MDKELLEKFIKSSLDNIDLKIYNDRAITNAKYPYIVLNSSKADTYNYPRVDIELEINIWDKQANFESVNKIADIIQKSLDRQSFIEHNVVGTYYLNTRNNVDDEDKTLKRNRMTFDVEIYFKEEE